LIQELEFIIDIKYSFSDSNVICCLQFYHCVKQIRELLNYYTDYSYIR